MSSSPLRSMGEWLNVNGAAERLGLHNNTVKRIAPSELPFVRIRDRGDRRYRVSDVDAYIESRMVRD